MTALSFISFTNCWGVLVVGGLLPVASFLFVLTVRRKPHRSDTAVCSVAAAASLWGAAALCGALQAPWSHRVHESLPVFMDFLIDSQQVTERLCSGTAPGRQNTQGSAFRAARPVENHRAG